MKYAELAEILRMVTGKANHIEAAGSINGSQPWMKNTSQDRNPLLVSSLLRVHPLALGQSQVSLPKHR